MAEKFDVAGRLAEGEPAVDDIQTLVWASHLVGYQNPELTTHAAQVREWYASEDGLNLRLLDADSAALGRAVVATEDALGRQDGQLAAVSAAWQGGGADASYEFLRRHADASSAAAAALRKAAETLATLRDELWRLVDGKAAASTAANAQRQDWLAAAQTVATGVGDRAAASELIDQQVKPFVDNTIGGEWLAAMRSTGESVADAYDAATQRVTAERDAVFDVPTGLGPVWTPASGDGGHGFVATTPAAAVPSVAMPAPAASIPPPPVAPWAPVAPAAAPEPTMPAASAPSAPAVGGLPDVGGGLSGFGQQLADMLGGLLGSADGDGLPDPAELGDPTDLGAEEPGNDDEQVDDEEQVDDDEDSVDDEDPVQEQKPVDEKADACEAEPSAETEPPAEAELADPAPTPVPEAPDPVATTGTPCEIAADELPQVGE